MNSYVTIVAVIGFERVEYNTTETDGGVEIRVVVLRGVLSAAVEVSLSTMDGTAVGK